MNIQITRRAYQAILLLLVSCAACVTLERSYPEIRYYVIAIPDRGDPPSSTSERILSVANLRISPRFADKNFVYRTSESGYETDYYNQFLISPDLNVAEEVRKGLAASQLFKYVVGPSNQLASNYSLEGSINALYGDFRKLNAPMAVLEFEVFLHNEDSATPSVVLQKRYIKSVPVSARSPEALVKGWNDALNEILAALIADLKAVKS
ncbi:MAG TPA: ABC-type transport auxiliary lipoprotein family protein [Candidatus Binatia bacterium]